jgi:hypothetical protein
VAIQLKCTLSEARFCDVTLFRSPKRFANTSTLPRFMAAAELIVLLTFLAPPLYTRQKMTVIRAILVAQTAREADGVDL